MIHHASFGVAHPDRVAHALAILTDATAVRAPTPPFPYDTWFVVAGDDRGSLLEILPATTVLDPTAPLGVRQRTATFGPAATHVLLGAAVTAEEIHAVAAREDWPAQEAETGLFKVIKLWIDGTVLVEFLTSEEAARYTAAFGIEGLTILDKNLRQLEQDLANVLSLKMPTELLADALGRKPA